VERKLGGSAPGEVFVTGGKRNEGRKFHAKSIKGTLERILARRGPPARLKLHQIGGVNVNLRKKRTPMEGSLEKFVRKGAVLRNAG